MLCLSVMHRRLSVFIIMKHVLCLIRSITFQFQRALCAVQYSLFLIIFCFVSILNHSGAFAECYTEEDQKKCARHNVFLLYELGAFSAMVQLLGMEIE